MDFEKTGAVLPIFWNNNSLDNQNNIDVSAKIAKVRCHLDLRHHIFSCRVIDRWNSLPQNVIDSSRVNCFKNALDKIRKTTMGFFED